VPTLDRENVRKLADDVAIYYARSSAHPIQCAITLRIFRDGTWRTIHLFDNSHAVEEHHEHHYVGHCKQAPHVRHGATNDLMAAAIAELRARWRELVRTWEHRS